MPFNTLEVDQQRGLKLGHDPASAVLVCGHRGSGVQQGSVKGEAGVTGHQQIYQVHGENMFVFLCLFCFYAMLILQKQHIANIIKVRHFWSSGIVYMKAVPASWYLIYRVCCHSNLVSKSSY